MNILIKLKNVEVMVDTYWNIIGNNQDYKLFIIPVRNRKGWWQFWRTPDNLNIEDIMNKYKKSIDLD